MTQVCPSCHAQNAADARFCNQCGARLAAAPQPAAASYTPQHLTERVLRTRAAMQGERKRVTVLFADIKGSTRLAQEAGAEAWHDILDRFFAILSGAVHRYEGTVNQYTGDGIMALFGAPVAHEDHARRAGLAALEMQAQVRRYADELRLSRGLNLSMRVGLNTGEVIVGRIGDDLRMDYTAQGHTVNLAARMEHICEPGRVYLSRYTARGIEGYFRLRDLGRMQVAGVDEPVEVYELEGQGELNTRLDRSLSRYASSFVGRDAEVASLQQALQSARDGRGQVVAVVGNAGIGKSRLCHEFTQDCERRGIVVHRATGVPYAHALPLYPVQMLARARMGLDGRASAGDVRRWVAGALLMHKPQHADLLPVIFDFLGVADGREKMPEPSEAQREKLLDLMTTYIACGDEQCTQVLLIEDLHFLDAASESFIARLAQRVRESRTLLLLNYRPDYISEWLIPLLDEQVSVSALGAAQLEQMAQSLLGEDASLAGLATRIRERASGNPFFVEEAVQALAEEAYLGGSPGAYTLLRPIVQWPIADTVHALLATRIDRLPEALKILVQTAAVIGHDFSPSLLAELTAQSIEDCHESLHALEDAGFVHQKQVTPDSEYAFCHPLMQEVAYQVQLESRRAAVHARLAQALVSRHPDDSAGKQAVNIAYHWEQAGDWAQAGAWNLRAAQWAITRDLNIASDQFQAARRNLDRVADADAVIRQRIQARAGLIRLAQFVPTAPEAVEAAYVEARQMADQCGDRASVAELLLSYGAEHLHRAQVAQAVRLADEAVRLCIAHGLTALVERFRLNVLILFTAAGQPREGLALVDEATGSDWHHGPISETNFMSRGYYGVMLSWLGRMSEAQANLSSAQAFAEREDRTASWMYAAQVDVDWISRRGSQSLASARRAYERAQASSSPFFNAMALRALGVAHTLQGDYAQAIDFLEQSLPLVAPGSFAYQFEPAHRAALARACLGAGRAEEAARHAQHAVDSARKSGAQVYEIHAWIALLELPATVVPAALAAQGLARMQALIDHIGAEGFRGWLSLAQAQWCADAAQAERYRLLARQQFE
ncbi:MAG TPA: adenylate/guanylate cyclase domain-containing protein, partial [Stenotrophobium sp.]|nr:adenylate/guanylate cyclase domain-containing protein [Stenotrophobium sp.]